MSNIITKDEAKAEVTQQEVMHLVDIAIAKSLNVCPEHCRVQVSIKKTTDGNGLKIETTFVPKDEQPNSTK